MRHLLSRGNIITRLAAVFLWGAITLFVAGAAAPPIDGTWEGTRDGTRAATVTLHEKSGIVSGSAVFYMTRNNADGTQSSAAIPALPLSGVHWDGKTLRFSVTRQDGVSLPFEMKLTGEGKAQLTAKGVNAEPGESIPMVLRK